MGQEVPGDIEVVITSPEEVRLVGFQEVVAEEDAGVAVEMALAALKFGDRVFEPIIIGVDPGKRPGIAAVAGNQVLFARELTEPEGIKEALEDIVRIYPGEYILKCGAGGGVYRDRILRTLQEGFKIPIYLVDEAGTTPMDTEGLGPNVIAAINMAFKEGRRLRRRIRPEATRGEKKTVQKRSRKVTGNITISSQLAERVAAGELSLEEAIRIHRRGK